ncbi:T9SS type A sorting domain-containing protein [bacterium]|nr:T9SS type A sorting domain-containing protein [bacterium]
MKTTLHIMLVIHIIWMSHLSGATFVVIDTLDSGPGTLRNAMILANNQTGTDTILFQIPGTNLHTIYPNSGLPQIIDPSGVLIDGFSQTGAVSGNTPPATIVLKVALDGTNAGASHGLFIRSKYNTIQGLAIMNFKRDGIRIEGSPEGTAYNTIYSNFIGTDPSGTSAQGNGTNQLSLWAGVNVIVVPALDDVARTAYQNYIYNNLISKNFAIGISIANCPPGDVYETFVTGNYVGTDITGIQALGNLHCGIYIGEGAHDNVIDKNTISGNAFEGISITGFEEAEIITYNNLIEENIIGLDVHLSPLPNGKDGINIGEYYGTQYHGGYAINNIVGPNNIIAENGDTGVRIWEHPKNNWNGDGNRITKNSIYHNHTLGIDLDDAGVNMNDASDSDMGANQEHNFPNILSAIFVNGQTTITGTIDNTPLQNIVELFKSASDPTGHGEGKTYILQTVPDQLGNWTVITTVLNPGDTVTATATDTLNMNTSEFSANVAVIDQSTGIDARSSQTAAFDMMQNYPNPFNNGTLLTYCLPKRSPVDIRIYNDLGKEVHHTVYKQKETGIHQEYWNGKDQDGYFLPSGIYFFRVITDSFMKMKKMVLLK